MSRYKGRQNRFTNGEPVRLCVDEARTGKIVSSDLNRLTAEVDWDAGGRSTELWCRLWKANEPGNAGIPFPNLDPGRVPCRNTNPGQRVLRRAGQPD